MLTCHDEYLLASMVQGVDGALVGFASLIPELLIDLYQAVCDGDLHRARRIQERVSLLKEAVYANEEPSGDAHARMKAAMMMSGRFPFGHDTPADSPSLQRAAGQDSGCAQENGTSLPR